LVEAVVRKIGIEELEEAVTTVRTDAGDSRDAGDATLQASP
jgi:hypothetical protein